MSLIDFFCSKCSLQFDNKIIYDMHLSIVHKLSVDLKEELLIYENKPSLGKEKLIFQCYSCDSKFATEISWNQHIFSHQEVTKLFKCKLFDYSCSQKGDLNIHFESGHEEKKTFRCEKCGKSLTNEAKLAKHIGAIHEGNRPFKCEICD